MTSERTLLIATGNRHKLLEIANILSGDQLHVLGLDDVKSIPEPAEDGDTFAANARIKATEYARKSGLPSLADDSGLCVDALSGRPGVVSSRYAELAGSGSGDAANNALVLEQLQDVEVEARTAAFHCAMCLALPDGRVVAEVDGRVDGHIMLECLGENGFGYDPMFRPLGHRLTFGQLPAEIKRGISHRTNALRLMRPKLQAHFGPPPTTDTEA